MSSSPIEKRKYVRLTASEWTEIRSLWETGDCTLAELSETYDASVRTLQAHFSKHGTEKGSAAQALSASVQARVFDQGLASEDLTTSRALAARESAYSKAVIIEDLLMGQLDLARQDPSAAFKASAAIKSLSLAAAALERLHSLKRSALGLGRDDDGGLVEIPEIFFAVMSDAEAEAMHSRGSDDGDEIDESDSYSKAVTADPGDDEIVIET